MTDADKIKRRMIAAQKREDEAAIHRRNVIVPMERYSERRLEKERKNGEKKIKKRRKSK